jgi:hypothetical protein
VGHFQRNRKEVTSRDSAGRIIINMDLDADPIERTLGLVWDFRRDVFVLGAKADPGGRTKRDLLKSIFSIFDPLGFLAPIVFQAKVLMQDIWRHKFDWDDELSQDLIDRWIRWAENLPSLSGLVLKRCIAPSREDIVAVLSHTSDFCSAMDQPVSGSSSRKLESLRLNS